MVPLSPQRACTRHYQRHRSEAKEHNDLRLEYPPGGCCGATCIVAALHLHCARITPRSNCTDYAWLLHWGCMVNVLDYGWN